MTRKKQWNVNLGNAILEAIVRFILDHIIEIVLATVLGGGGWYLKIYEMYPYRNPWLWDNWKFVVIGIVIIAIVIAWGIATWLRKNLKWWRVCALVFAVFAVLYGFIFGLWQDWRLWIEFGLFWLLLALGLGVVIGLGAAGISKIFESNYPEGST
jgi:hypothetical protein